jgi:hypothetical protein
LLVLRGAIKHLPQVRRTARLTCVLRLLRRDRLAYFVFTARSRNAAPATSRNLFLDWLRPA